MPVDMIHLMEKDALIVLKALSIADKQSDDTEEFNDVLIKVAGRLGLKPDDF